MKTKLDVERFIVTLRDHKVIAAVTSQSAIPKRGRGGQRTGELEKQLTGRLDVHEVAIVQVLQELMKVINPPPPPPDPPKPQIGFQPRNKRS